MGNCSCAVDEQSSTDVATGLEISHPPDSSGFDNIATQLQPVQVKAEVSPSENYPVGEAEPNCEESSEKHSATEVSPPAVDSTPLTVHILAALRTWQARKVLRTLRDLSVDYSIKSEPQGVDLEEGTQATMLLSPQVQVVLGMLQPLKYGFSIKGANYHSSKRLTDGSIFEGQWTQRPSGTLVRKGKGKLYHTDGSYWEGYWKGARLHLFGRVIYPNGDYYEGQFRAGLRSGSGEFVSFDRTKRYKGEWWNDGKHGLGEESLADGSKYSGEFANNVKHGRGSIEWPDGSFYNGAFYDGKLHGKGVFRWKDGRVYDGDWKLGKMHGYGSFVYADGKKYIGEYANDKREGWGTYTWEGKVYEGQWLAGKMHGKGFLALSDKSRKCYMFENGQRKEEVQDEILQSSSC